ncbi:MAG TPA: DUF4832 domain-containing protein [Terriglobia bacterium]|nr:DUF4832 domain-containing protein [Terriglobia bacterium]
MRLSVTGALAALMICASLLPAQNNMVVVRPKEIDTVLVNPGMGIQTFQRFNGDALNPGLRWSEEGPTTVLQPAAEKPDFPESSISYCRWFWNVLEPQQGRFNWSIIDLALKEARAHHQTLAIRMMPYDENHPLPEWYRNSGARRANKPADRDGNIWQPDFSDPLYLKYWGELVAAAGKRYDGNPYLEMVDISSIGYWGEGWSDYMPAFKYQKPLIDIYLDAFKRTPLLMNFDQAEALAYGVSHGSGWRLDCWGDMGMLRGEKESGRSLMLDRYPEQVVETGIQNAWMRSPVSLESCGVVGTWLKYGYDVNYILDQALRWHVSSVNIKSSAIPPQWKKQFEEFEKKMGYRFILRRLEYPRSVRPGEMMPVNFWFLNAGVAPVYRPYILAIDLRSSNGEAVIKTPADVRKWLPGDAVSEGTVFVPMSLKPGEYHFRVGLLDPRTEQPAIKLANEGLQPDGWYDLGMIQVQQSAP